MKKTLISIAVVLGFLVPAFAFAQTSTTTGLLTVYVQVQNQSGFSYVPSNFNVSVSGQSPSPSSFAGSLQGTLVSLNAGPYSVTITNPMSGYTASYSVGCNSTISAGQSQTCVVTLTGGQYTGGTTPYPYQYPFTPQLTCRTDTPTVSLGQAARFTALGGVGGTYNWYAGGQNFPNAGPVLTPTFQSSGTHTVQVTNAAQTAVCTVTVTNTYVPQPTPAQYPTYPTYPTYPGYTYPTYQSGYPYTYPTVTSTAYPRLPNAGFAPLESAQLAFAVVLLLGAGIAVFPYARKVFALAVR